MNGKLTPTQTLRRAMIQNAGRERVIEMIAKAMYAHAKLHRKGGGTPRSFYSRPIADG